MDDVTALRQMVIKKIASEWPTNWATLSKGRYGLTFSTVEDIPNKNGFFSELKEKVDESLKSKFELDEAGKRSVSDATIERFLRSTTSPSIETKDALSVYVGFDSWDKFVESRKAKKPKDWKLQVHNHWVAGSVLIILVLLGVFLWLWSQPTITKEKPTIDVSKIKFEVKSATNRQFFPTKVVMSYDLSQIGQYDSAFINYNDEKVPLLQPRGEIEHVFIHPKSSPVFIRVNRHGHKFVHSFPLFIKSPTWQATIKDTANNVVTGFNFIHNGVLQLPFSEIPHSNRTIDFYTYFTKIDDFGIAIDSSVFTFKVKNALSEGGISCFDFNLSLSGDVSENDGFGFNILHPSCAEFAGIVIDDRVIGYDHRLQRKATEYNGILTDMTDWKVVKLRFRNKKIQIWLDGQLQQSFGYSKQFGNLRHTTFSFKGCGAMDFLKISNSYTGKQVYFEDFN